MFDLSDLDRVQVDHMLADTRYRVLRAFTDASGAAHAAGGEFVYRSAHLNMAAKRLTLRVEADGGPVQWVLEYAGGQGPRPGNLRDYFEDAGYVGAPVEERERDAEPGVEPRPMPKAPGAGPFGDLYNAALAADFERAEALLKQIDGGGGLGDYHTEKLGSWLMQAAHAAGGPGRDGARWLARKAMREWEFWTSCSTSGGEGTARSRDVAQIRKQLAGYLP